MGSLAGLSDRQAREEPHLFATPADQRGTLFEYRGFTEEEGSSSGSRHDDVVWLVAF